MTEQPAPRRRRRAVGPPGARPGEESDLELGRSSSEPAADAYDDDERLRREVPPHHSPPR